MKRILIVDDSEFMRNVLKDMIISNSVAGEFSENFEIFEADSKKEALIHAKRMKPDVILLDIVMMESEMEGVEFIMEANQFFDLNKIIMVTSIGHMDVISTCKNLGIKYYIQKPFDKTEIVDSIKKIIEASDIRE